MVGPKTPENATAETAAANEEDKIRDRVVKRTQMLSSASKNRISL